MDMCTRIPEDNYNTVFSRISPESMQMLDINAQKNSSSSFSFPALPPHIVSPDEPVDVRVSVCTLEGSGHHHQYIFEIFLCFLF